ncbi:MAG: PUA domain-containing protein [Thermoprotei archaeon]
MRTRIRGLDEKLLFELSRVYGSLTRSVIEKLAYPPSRLYLRVNTIKISREELISKLRNKGIDVLPDPYVEEAVYIPVKGPFTIEDTGKRIHVDKYAAESIILGAYVYAPGVIAYDEFEKDDLVTIMAPNGEAIAVARAVIGSRELKKIKQGIVGVTIKSKYYVPPLRELDEYKSGFFIRRVYQQFLQSKQLILSRENS